MNGDQFFVFFVSFEWGNVGSTLNLLKWPCKVETSRAGCPLERGRGEFTGGTKLSQAQGPTKLNRGGPLGEGRGPGAGRGHAGRLLGESGGRCVGGHAGRLLGESGGCRVVAATKGRLLGESSGCRGGAAKVGCLAAGVMLGCIGRRVPRSANHRRQVVPVHMPNTGTTQVVLGQCANLASIAQT